MNMRIITRSILFSLKKVNNFSSKSTPETLTTAVIDIDFRNDKEFSVTFAPCNHDERQSDSSIHVNPWGGCTIILLMLFEFEPTSNI